ncbi:MAG: phenylalanine--tRNA ligase subunit alpha [Candidatus Methylomirabilales bacterium]
MEKDLQAIESSILPVIEGADEPEALEQIRVHVLGRRGQLTEVLRGLGALPPEMRREIGQQANALKVRIEQALQERQQILRALRFDGLAVREAIDITLPGRPVQRGSLHPLIATLYEIVEIFQGLGFSVAEGPEVELDYYNFEALNIPRDHPARDMQDTFYVTDDVLLRTHTSPVQIRVMEAQTPPVRIVAPGRVYRRDADPTHSPMFHQVEGLLVDQGVSFADLKGTLQSFVEQFFGAGTRLRFRPSFFPFTEPSAEVDIGCVMCRGAGCRVCKGSGFLEILGCGMVDPEVFRMVGYDPEITGFAFGLGVERIAMLRYGIDDIRLFFENDLRFLQQFPAL